MNVYMLDVNSGRESFQCGVVETMERAEQTQILRNPLGQSLSERMVMNS